MCIYVYLFLGKGFEKKKNYDNLVLLNVFNFFL